MDLVAASCAATGEACWAPSPASLVSARSKAAPFPRHLKMTSKPASTASSPSEYSPRIHSAVASTVDAWMSGKAPRSLCTMPALRGGYCSTMARTKTTTSVAPSLPRKSMSTCTTLPATSGNLRAQAWMLWMSMARYSLPFSRSESRVRTTSRFSTATTSSMLRGETRSMAMLSVLLQISTSGEASARRMSMRISVRTRTWRFRISAKRSSTMSLMLLSDCEHSRLVYVVAAARTAVGAEDSDTKVHAASYETAAEGDPKSWNRKRTNRDFCAASLRHTLRVNSRTSSANPSPKRSKSSALAARKSMADSSASLDSIKNALRRAPSSASLSINFSITSAASGSSAAPKCLCAWKTQRAAFLRTYEWRCSRHARMEGMSGSMISASVSLQRNRSMEPRTNSLAWFKSLRRALQTRIISGSSLRSVSYFGTISQKSIKSFLSS
mmetsp:Transcript_7931/g.25930  ORF Transcript_7931/g.25930 Transcript_7931/m.25930 type:complete len:441 (+) Transcript_7931:1462-2784(+)